MKYLSGYNLIRVLKSAVFKPRKYKGYKIAIGVLILIIILQWVFIISIRPKKPHKVPVAFKGKIAIVIDDWGYSLNNIPIVEKIKFPFTASVLPNLNHSQRVSEYLHKKGHEVILHLPMEPQEKYKLEKNTILVSMNEPEVKRIIEKDLASVNYAKGVSNHMGSQATENSRIMIIVFKELKKRHLYFLDSYVSAKSVCTDLARKMNLVFAKRDIFLDNKEEPGYIRKQIYKLKSLARTKGSSIGIGHDRKVTLEVLKDAMPELEKEGYRLVPLSELVR